MKSVIALVLVLAGGSAAAEGFKSVKEARAFADAMMATIYEERFQEAFDRAKPYWPIPTVEIDGIVNQIKGQWPVVRQRFGKTIETEFVRREAIGKSFVRYYYLHKFENHAIYWRMDFYRPHDEWKINKIEFRDALDLLYE